LRVLVALAIVALAVAAWVDWRKVDWKNVDWRNVPWRRLGSLLPQAPPQASDPKLSVLLISIDTLRADALGAYGNARARTPWIDRLARGGVRFDAAYAHNVVTLPSHVNRSEEHTSDSSHRL